MASGKDDNRGASDVSSAGKTPAGKRDASGSEQSPARKRDDAALSSRSEVDAFLDAVKQTPPVATGDGRGRLIFSLDATASRQRTWDRAMALQSDMFIHTRGIGSLDVQLVYYRGYDECRASPWLGNADKVIAMMRKVSCLAGTTQIARVLKHSLAECRSEAVQALVFIGDCVEENVDELGNLAGQARLLGLPVFIFQEGYEPHASRVFAQMAKLSGGAHCRFNESSARQLGELLNAVAAYAAGGRAALQQLEQQGSRQAGSLLEQLS
ncbi:VWA domain-containing protein [Granulosicoccus sp. 3-233]|uniref:VWA domain-containing protein n=1 Tax=Granulosicoccus sp. 3-233 TaxID=3417969 RepID=UPI003D33584E